MTNVQGGNIECRSDGNHGFNMGGNGNIGPRSRSFNLTVLGHNVNERDYVTVQATGGGGNLGPNRPLLSAHPGGANVGLADGSVHFLNEAIALLDLYNLADRDDGNVANVEF